MSHQIERRAANNALSPDILAVLVMCGAEIRESDRAALPEVCAEQVQDARSADRRQRDRRQGDRRVAQRVSQP
jgi:hypothetical protein